MADTNTKTKHLTKKNQKHYLQLTFPPLNRKNKVINNRPTRRTHPIYSRIPNVKGGPLSPRHLQDL